MGADDWYRNTKWNSSIEEHFYSKLKRARSQRDQYLVIQASTLSRHRPDVTHRLVEEYFSSRKDQYEDVRALWARAKAFLAEGNITGGIEAYKAILKREAEFPSHQTTVYVDYPYLVATLKITEEYEFALQTLQEHEDRLMFPVDYYKWFASIALMKSSSDYACQALEAAKIKKSGFRFHQDVGLVGKEHAKTIRKLRKLCT